MMNEEEKYQKVMLKRSKIFALVMGLATVIIVVVFIFGVKQRIERIDLEDEIISLKAQVEVYEASIADFNQKAFLEGGEGIKIPESK